MKGPRKTPAMRRLFLSLCVLLLITGVFLPTALLHAKPANAVGATCWWSDALDTWYDDWYYTSSEQIVDTDYGGNDTWHVDLKAYRYTRSSDGHCLRYYYGSIWDSNGWHQQVQVSLRTWVCGSYSGTWSAANLNPNPWYRVGMTTGILDYGTGPCYPQADDYISFAHSYVAPGDLYPTPDNSVVGNCVFVNFDGSNGPGRLPNCNP